MEIFEATFQPKSSIDLKSEYFNLIGTVVRVWSGGIIDWNSKYQNQEMWNLLEKPFGWLPSEDLINFVEVKGLGE